MFLRVLKEFPRRIARIEQPKSSRTRISLWFEMRSTMASVHRGAPPRLPSECCQHWPLDFGHQKLVNPLTMFGGKIVV